MAYSGCPLMREHDVTFHAATAVTGVRRKADAFYIFVNINGKTTRLALTFPALGGVRLAAKGGFFAAADNHPITYSGQKVIRMTAGDEKATFSRDAEKGFVLTVYGKNGNPAFTLSGDDLQFGIDAKGKCGRMRFFVPFKENEVLYGLGERYDRLDRRGLHAYLWNVDTAFGGVQGEAYQNVPLMHSTAGYALFFNTMFGGNTDSGVTVPDKTLYDFNGDAQDLFVFTGTPLENLDSYTRLTGRPILPPRWAYEYWMGASLDGWRFAGKDPLVNLKEYIDGYADMGIHHVAACYGETAPCQTKEAYEMLEPSGCRMLFWNFPAYGRKDSAALLHTTSPARLPHPMMKKGSRYVLPDNWLDFTHPDAKTVMRHKYARYFDWGLKGAMIDFGPLLSNPKLMLFGAAAQFGIFFTLSMATLLGFDLKNAASIAIIGAADGPTSIFVANFFQSKYIGAIMVAAYSYMALVPVIIPLVVKIWCTKKELSINMKEQEKKYPSSVEIKNLRVLKIVFPIVVTTVVALFVPSAVPLIGMLMFGNLIKEIGSDTSRLFDAASNSIMNAATIFLGLSVGATMTTEAFLNWTTIGIVIGGFLAFALSISGGILFVKLVNLFTKKKINPLIGATGLSAVPMASRVANEIALKYDPKNHVLQYCMASNISGVIGSAVAAGVLISFLQ